MKKHIIKFIIGLMAVPMLFSACKKDAPDKWLQDNITIIGKLPVIAGFTVKPPQTLTVASGATIQLDLRYWSDDPIDKVNLRATVGAAAKQMISTTAYQKAYSTVSRTDSLLLPYAVPTGLTTGSSIVMEVEVVNKNTLTKLSTLTLKIQ